MKNKKLNKDIKKIEDEILLMIFERSIFEIDVIKKIYKRTGSLTKTQIIIDNAQRLGMNPLDLIEKIDKTIKRYTLVNGELIKSPENVPD